MSRRLESIPLRKRRQRSCGLTEGQGAARSTVCSMSGARSASTAAPVRSHLHRVPGLSNLCAYRRVYRHSTDIPLSRSLLSSNARTRAPRDATRRELQASVRPTQQQLGRYCDRTDPTTPSPRARCMDVAWMLHGCCMGVAWMTRERCMYTAYLPRVCCVYDARTLHVAWMLHE